MEEGKIKAYFLYAKEEGQVFIQEVMESKEGTLPFLRKESKRQPVIMARIIHLEEMLKLVVSETPKTVLLEVEDNLLPQNDGLYRLEITQKGSVVTKLKEARPPDVICNIRELGVHLLTKLFINEIV